MLLVLTRPVVTSSELGISMSACCFNVGTAKELAVRMGAAQSLEVEAEAPSRAAMAVSNKTSFTRPCMMCTTLGVEAWCVDRVPIERCQEVSNIANMDLQDLAVSRSSSGTSSASTASSKDVYDGESLASGNETAPIVLMVF